MAREQHIPNYHRNTWHHIPQDCHGNIHCHQTTFFYRITIHVYKLATFQHNRPTARNINHARNTCSLSWFHICIRSAYLFKTWIRDHDTAMWWQCNPICIFQFSTHQSCIISWVLAPIVTMFLAAVGCCQCGCSSVHAQHTKRWSGKRSVLTVHICITYLPFDVTAKDRHLAGTDPIQSLYHFWYTHLIQNSVLTRLITMHIRWSDTSVRAEECSSTQCRDM
jgi:hypothetical protein